MVIEGETVLITLKHPDGLVYVEELKTGRKCISIKLLNQLLFVPINTCETSYPLELIEQIMKVKGLSYLCDEILRDENPMYVQHSIEYDILSYVSEDRFDKKEFLMLVVAVVHLPLF